MATLYEMTEVTKYLIDLFEDGEIDEKTLNDTLEAYGVDGKLEDYCKVIRQFEADAFIYKTEKLRFAEKQSRVEKAVEKLKSAIITYLEVRGSNEAKVGAFELKLRRNESVVIDDLLKINDDYLRYKEPEADKTKIKNAIKSGIVIEGAHIEAKHSVNIK